MAVNSKQKGNTFERHIAKTFSQHFSDDFRRVPQSGALVGGTNRFGAQTLREDAKEILAGDIIVPQWFKFIVECKHYKDEPKFHSILQGSSLTLDRWIEQANGDAVFANKLPLVVFKVTRVGEFACFDAGLQDVEYKSYPYMVYKGKVILELSKFLISLGNSYYKE